MSELLNPGIFQLSVVSGFFAWGTIYYMIATKAPTDPSYRWIELLACIHVFRYIGLIAFVPRHFDAAAMGLPVSFQYIAGFGDWIAGVLAMLTIVAVRRNWSLAIHRTFDAARARKSSNHRSRLMEILTKRRSNMFSLVADDRFSQQ